MSRSGWSSAFMALSYSLHRSAARSVTFPLPTEVGKALTEHMRRFPPTEVTLPWLTPDGEPLTKTLMFTNTRGNAVWRSAFNDQSWKPALATAGIIPEPEKGERYASARKHGMHALRHFYASVLLDAGESIKAPSTYLGHSDPASRSRSTRTCASTTGQGHFSVIAWLVTPHLAVRVRRGGNAFFGALSARPHKG